MPPMEGGRDRIVKNLNEKLASVLLDCHAKDDLVTKNVKMAPEANAGDLLLSLLLLIPLFKRPPLKVTVSVEDQVILFEMCSLIWL